MSDTNEYCVCYEATEHLTPCNHLVCESCYPRLNICPMCRAPLENGVPPMEVSVDELNLRMAEAAEAGHEDIVRLMLFQGASDLNMGLTSAASGGHESIVRLMLDQGATNYNEAMNSAAYCGQIHIVRLMLEKGANDFNDAMETAALTGHLSIVELMLEKGANNHNETMETAALNGHLNIVELMLEKGLKRDLSLKIYLKYLLASLAMKPKAGSIAGLLTLRYFKARS